MLRGDNRTETALDVERLVEPRGKKKGKIGL